MARTRKTRTIVAAASSVVLGTATAIVVNVLTDGWGWVWWAVLGVLVVVTTAVYVLSDSGASPRVLASGAGAVAGGGDLTGKVTTKVRGKPTAGSAGGDGVGATGPGSVAAGGDVADVETDVRSETE
ncbi:hypothetical protein ACWEF6_00535 [Amycolatopsis sp. NPDC004772]